MTDPHTDFRQRSAMSTSHRTGGAFEGDTRAFLPRRVGIGWILLGWMALAGGFIWGLLSIT